MALALMKAIAMPQKTRRNFLLSSLAMMGGLVGCSTGKLSRKQDSTVNPQAVALTHPPATMPERILGKTGLSLPILGLGGAGRTPLSKPGQRSNAIALVERALQLGIRYFDTAASYGPSEEFLGEVLPASRKEIVLASKTAARDRDGAWRDLERTLTRLKTDHLDIWQLHHVSFETELDEIFSAQGAIRAIEEAREQNIIRFCGITGHHEPQIIAMGLDRYPFDMALVSINAADAHHPRPFAPTVLPIAQKNDVGIIAMKIPAYGKLLQPGVLSGMSEAMGYTLSLPGVHGCIIAAENPEQLEANVKVAQAFQPLSEEERAAIVDKVAASWEENTFFRQWT